jgi:hypothetical protein
MSKKRISIVVLILLSLVIASAPAVLAAPILVQTGDASAVLVNDPIVLSWTQPSLYTGVTIMAAVSSNNFGPNGAGTIWLTTKVGPGTTWLDVVASTELTGVPYAVEGPAVLTELFSGLTLGPDTYYLVLSSDGKSPGLGWVLVKSPISILAPGVTTATLVGLGGAPFPPVYDGLFPETADLAYSITGTSPAVPEPASLCLFGTGLVGLRTWRKRRA